MSAVIFSARLHPISLCDIFPFHSTGKNNFAHHLRQQRTQISLKHANTGGTEEDRGKRHEKGCHTVQNANLCVFFSSQPKGEGKLYLEKESKEP